MRVKWIAIASVLGLLALPALAAATPQLTATEIRIGDHAAYVRVVVNFSGGTLTAGDIENAWGDDPSTASVIVQRRDAGTQASPASAYGVAARVVRPSHFLRVDMHLKHKFKYLSYAVVTGNRLAIDLWKSKVPRTPSHTCSGLTLSPNWSSNGSTVSVSGHEHGIFENQFQVIVRGAHGAVLGRKTVHGPGKWAAKVQYHVAVSQPGTVEAVSFSAKDGALECLAQKPVQLPAT
jgi:hypothetical protein